MHARRLSGYRSRILVMLTIAALTASAAMAAPGKTPKGKADYAERYTVALFTYATDNGKPRFAKAFSGLLTKDGQILTSSWALQQGLTNPFAKTRSAEPGMIVAVIRKGDSAMVVRCTRSPLGEGSPIAVLQVDDSQKELVAQVVTDEVKKTKLKPQPNTVVVGVVSPDGLRPKQISPAVVPLPLAMSIRLGDLRSFGDGQYEGAEVLASLPPQMVGGGVWDPTGNLMGVLIRTDAAWHVMDTKDIARILSPPKKVEVVAGEPSGEPMVEKTPEGPKGRTVADIMKELKLERALDEKFTDDFRDAQVNEVMALVMANKAADALKKIEELEKSAGGDARDQLLYLKAMAMILSGKFEEPRPLVEKAQRSSDPIVASRSRMIYQVLVKAPSGTFEGKKITEPDGLKAACLGWMETIKGQVEEAFDAAKIMEVTDASTWKRKDNKLEQALSRAETYKFAWPGYFDEITNEITKVRTEAAAKAPK